MGEHHSKTIQDLLSERSLKVTKVRVQVLELIQSYDAAIPFSKIQEECKELDRVTLYRTIQTLLEKGIIHKAYTDNNNTFYALCGHSCSPDQHAHNHVHFECTKCGQITCEELPKEVKIHLPNFQIESTEIHLTGLCEKCK